MENSLEQSEKFKYLVVSDYEIGLTKLIGKKIKEIRGYMSSEYGAVFKLTKIEFEDGTFLGCEGEHDYPYLVTWCSSNNPEYCNGYTDEILEEIYEEQSRLDGDE